MSAMSKSIGQIRDEETLEQALKVTPGASQTWSKAPGRVGPSDVASGFPLFADYGDGPFLHSAGRKYLDFAGANAAIPLGYNNVHVTKAVEFAARHGSLLSLPSRVEAPISAMFLDRCAPWASQVRWTRTGSEALQAAVRIARTTTGRGYVLVADSAYHGWHDWFQASTQSSDATGARMSLTTSAEADRAGKPGCFALRDVQRNGTPTALTETVAVFRYGDADDFARVATTLLNGAQDVAAVVIEPHRWKATDRAWLAQVRAWCSSVGAALIFDEMVYGLRWRVGGGAEYYDVAPDLACFGKALGNGVPIACVCGRPTWMAQTIAAGVSGTYGGDLIGLRAAEAVLNVYHDRDVIAELWANGAATWRGFKDAVRYSVAMLEGFHVHWKLTMPSAETLDRALSIAAESGVLVSRHSNNASAAMSEQDAYAGGKLLGEACCAALDEAKE